MDVGPTNDMISFLDSEFALSILEQSCFLPFNIFYIKENKTFNRIHKRSTHLGQKKKRRIKSNLHRFYIRQKELDDFNSFLELEFKDIFMPHTFQVKQKNIKTIIELLSNRQLNVFDTVLLFHSMFPLTYSSETLFEDDILYFELFLLLEIFTFVFYGKSDLSFIEKYVLEYRQNYLKLFKKNREEIEVFISKMSSRLERTPLDIYKNEGEMFFDILKYYIGNSRLLDQVNELEVKILMEAA